MHIYIYMCVYIHVYIYICRYTRTHITTPIYTYSLFSKHYSWPCTGWRRLIGSPKLQIIFHKRATKYRSLLRKITYKDKGSYESLPPCTLHPSTAVSPQLHSHEIPSIAPLNCSFPSTALNYTPQLQFPLNCTPQIPSTAPPICTPFNSMGMLPKGAYVSCCCISS